MDCFEAQKSGRREETSSHRMMLVLSKALLFMVMMPLCIESSIEGNCNITSIDYCDDVLNSSRGFADLGLRCDFTASTEDHIETPVCSSIAKGNNYEIRGDLAERASRSEKLC